jgi:HK97 family phage major capsid protein
MATNTVLPAFGGTLFPRQVSDMIFEDVADRSIVQQLARRVNLPASGVAIPITTGKPTASWVAEGGRKPASNATVSTKLMDPKKLTTIIVFSKEYLRSDPTRLFQMIRPQIQEAFADAFDSAAIHGTNSPFTAQITDTTKSIELGTTTQANGGVYGDIVAGLKLLVADRKKLTGFAADPLAEPLLLGAVDTTGRPLLVDSTASDGLTQRLIGRPVGFGEGVAGVDGAQTLRFIGGDWTKAAYGVGTEISYSVSTEASIEMIPGNAASTINLFQDNSVALLAEAEYGFVVGDVDAFVEYVDAI